MICAIAELPSRDLLRACQAMHYAYAGRETEEHLKRSAAIFGPYSGAALELARREALS